MELLSIFDYKKFKGNGTVACCLQDENNDKIGVCYAKNEANAIAEFKRRYVIYPEYSVKVFTVCEHTKLELTALVSMYGHCNNAQ